MKVAHGAIALSPASLAMEMRSRGCSALMLVRGSEMGKGADTVVKMVAQDMEWDKGQGEHQQ